MDASLSIVPLRAITSTGMEEVALIVSAPMESVVSPWIVTETNECPLPEKFVVIAMSLPDA